MKKVSPNQQNPNKRKKENAPSSLLSDEELSEYTKRAITIALGEFMLRHLNLVFEKFNGDFAAAIILGEIAHHNIFRFYSRRGQCIDVPLPMVLDKNWMQNMEPCNAYSISEATGIPRETVRRKVSKLIKDGLLVQDERSRLTINQNITEYFKKFNESMLKDLQATSDCINDFRKADGKRNCR
jgi:hypothetical protein